MKCLQLRSLGFPLVLLCLSAAAVAQTSSAPLTLQQAIDIPRWKHEKGLLIYLEEGNAPATFDAMTKLGHEVKQANFLTFGSAQAIRRDPDTGVLFGASDSRRDAFGRPRRACLG